MNRKKIGNLSALFCAATVMIFLMACNGENGNGNGDADAGDVPAEDVAVEDVVQEDTPEDPPEEDVPPDTPEEDVAEDLVDDEVIEDIVEEELPPVFCPVLGVGTASLGGHLSRGPNMLMDAADTALDSVGDIFILIYDVDPFITWPSPDPVAAAYVSGGVLTAETDVVEFCVQNIPPGDFWFVVIMDDDGSGVGGIESVGDIIGMPLPTGTLAADESVADARFALNVRIGRVYGSVTIDRDLASGLTDLTGDLFIAITDAATLSPPPAVFGFVLIEDVTLSPNTLHPYEVLLMSSPTAAEMGYLIAIFDVDESGITGLPQPGDIVNFSMGSPPVLPPYFTYNITGIEENIDTTMVSVYE